MITQKKYKEESDGRFSSFLNKKGINKSNVFEVIENTEKKLKIESPREDIVPYSGSIYFSNSMSISREKIEKLFRKMSFKF